jgi:hypothetical protein
VIVDEAAAEAASAVASDADLAAREALLEIRPTTVTGAAALARYSWEFSQQEGEAGLWGDGGYELHRHLPPGGSSSWTRCGKSRSFMCAVISDLRRVIAKSSHVGITSGRPWSPANRRSRVGSPGHGSVPATTSPDETRRAT